MHTGVRSTPEQAEAVRRAIDARGMMRVRVEAGAGERAVMRAATRLPVTRASLRAIVDAAERLLAADTTDPIAEAS